MTNKLLRVLSGLIVFSCLWVAPVAAESDFSRLFVMASKPRLAPVFGFQDESGQSMSLQDFKGRHVLLNLWATWCGTCVSEMPALQEVQRHFDPARLTVVALSVDRNGLAAVQSFYRRHGLSGLTPYLDPESLSIDALDARFLPTTFLIDKQGRIVGRIKGAVNWAAPEVISFLQEKTGE